MTSNEEVKPEKPDFEKMAKKSAFKCHPLDTERNVLTVSDAEYLMDKLWDDYVLPLQSRIAELEAKSSPLEKREILKEMLLVLKKVNSAIQCSNMKETILHSEIRTVIKKAKALPLSLPDEWVLSRKRMPDYDGFYYVYGFMHHSCGNVTPFHAVAECRMNQWVKTDTGQQMTYWRPLLEPPKEQNDEL